MPRHRAAPDLPLTIRRGRSPIPGQIVEQMRALVTSGGLRPGDPVPSTRALAGRLEISRGSVVTAYDQLVGEGYLVADHGSTRVTPDLPDVPPAVPARRPALTSASSGVDCEAGPVLDLRPGSPDISALASTGWRAAWRAAAAEPSLGYDAQGSPRLRAELVEYLRTMRSVVADPEDLLVTSGARDGLRILLAALTRREGRSLRVAVENPGYPSLHRVPGALGHEVIPIPLDADGLPPHALPGGDHRPDVVLVTPSHQYPLGASMPVARRLELIRWATRNGAVLVEDDYDSELRYVGDPLPALAALDPSVPDDGGCVVTLGSFAKTLTPGLGLGFLLIPGRLRSSIVDLQRDAGAPVSGIVQEAMTRFMHEDGLRRHTARMRREYRGRRDLLADILSPGQLPNGVTALPMDGGLHTVLELPDPETERAVAREARRRGVAVAELGEYWSGGSGGRAGVVVGYGGVSREKLAAGVEVVRAVLHDVSRGQSGG